jgi:hypothetical protein
MTMHKNLLAIFFGLLLISNYPLGAQTVTEEWLRSDANGYPYGSMIAMDSQENIVVTGWRLGSYIITKKYDSDGNLIWERQFTVPNLQAVATWILVELFDNVIITGYPRTFSSNPVEVGLLTIKYDSAGNLLWSDTYAGTWAFAVRGISDADGNIYVAGRAWFGTYDFVTIKYAPDGTRLWVDIFDQNSGFHTPNSMDLDSQGHLIINGGGLSGGFITVLYNTDGVRQWVVERFGNTTSWVKLTTDGFFYLTGSFYSVQTSTDIWLLKYDLAGNLIWERNYDFGVTSEYGKKLALDSQGNVFVTGIQNVPSDWITIKVDPFGNLLWSDVQNTHPSWDEYPNFIAVGPDDEAYITGTGGPCPPLGCSYRSMVTLRYNSDGSIPWTATTYATSQLGVGIALGVDNSVYVAGDFMLTLIKYAQTGISGQPPVVSDIPNQTAVGGRFAPIRVDNYVSDPDDPDTDITWSWTGNSNLRVTWDGVRRRITVRPLRGWTGVETITFTATDPSGLSDTDPATFTVTSADLERTSNSDELFPVTRIEGNYPNPFNPATTIRYSLATSSRMSLVVFNVLGQQVATLVDGIQEEGYHEAVFNGTGLPSGVYMCRLTTSEWIEVRKILLSK